MKWIKLFIVVISSTSLAASQNLAKTFSLAEMYYQRGDFRMAEKTYKRVLFFDEENLYRGRTMQNMARLSISQNEFSEALKYLDQAYFTVNDPVQQAELQLERIQVYIKSGSWQKALAELYQLDSDQHQKRAALYEGFCQYQIRDFTVAKAAFLSLVDDSLAMIGITDLINRAIKIEKMNAKTYQILSYAIPGLGQILLGNTKSSVNSILLNGALALLFIDTARKLSLFDATLSVLPWFYRYYAGGAKLTKDLAEQKKRDRHQKNLRDIIAFIQTTNR